MKFRRISRNVSLVILIILSVLRFFSLDKIPIFGDEANHLMLGEEVGRNPLSLIEFTRGGILPGLIIILSFLQRIFGGFNPLVIGRAFSVVCDLVSVYFLYLIGIKLFNSKIALLSSIIYLLIPLNIFHGRLVMLEPLMSTFFLAALYFSLKQRLFLVFVFLFFAFTTKPLVLVSIVSLLTLPFILKKKNWQKQILYLLGTVALVGIAILPYSLLSSNHFVNDYFSVNLGVFWFNFKTNLWRTYLWLKIYYPLPFVILALGGIVIGIREKSRAVFWAIGWAATVIILNSLVGGKFFYPRHLFPLAFPVSYIIGFSIFKLFQRKNLLTKFITVLLLLVGISNSFNYLISNEKVKLVPEDSHQFYEDWASGVGLKELANDLKKIFQDQEVVVYIGDEALLTWALPNVFDIGQVKLVKIDNYFGGNIPDLEKKIKRGPNNYLLLNREPYLPTNFKAKPVAKYPKGSNRSIVLYRLSPK